MLVHLNPFELLFALIIGHALADYPLQGDFLAKAKNRLNPLPTIHWLPPLLSHAIIHGGFVWVITGNVWLGLAETICHAIIDDFKCVKKISFNIDQALHLVCKLIWILLLFILK
jgi:hypothetical protein